MKYQAVSQTVQNLESSILAVISKLYCHISLSQKNKIELTAFNVATALKKWGKKPIRVFTKSCWKHWVVSMWEISCRDPRSWLLLLRDLVALDELKFEGKLFYVIFQNLKNWRYSLKFLRSRHFQDDDNLLRFNLHVSCFDFSLVRWLLLLLQNNILILICIQYLIFSGNLVEFDKWLIFWTKMFFKKYYAHIYRRRIC